MSATPNQQEPATKKKFSRNVGTRTRTGCTTCKIRRVKCEEARPYCKRCLAFWGRCDGYDAPPDAPVPISQRSLRSVAPAITRDPSLSAQVFNDDFEQRCFQTYAQEVAPRISLAGEFNRKEILTYLVPQVCWTEPALRRGCTALGALHVAQAQKQYRAMLPNQDNTKQLYAYALEQYQKALSAMREIQTVGTALISCLLIYSGCNFLSHTRSSELASTTGRMQVEEELVAAFRIFEYVSLSTLLFRFFLDNSSIKGPININLDTKDTFNATGITTQRLYHEEANRGPIPIAFSTIDEAREALEFNSLQQMYMLGRYIFASDIDRTKRRLKGESSFIKILQAAGIWTPLDDFRNSPEYRSQQASIAQMHAAWFVAAENLWKRSQITGDRDFYRMAGLRTVALYTEISHLTILTQECGYDKHLQYFQEIVMLVKTIMEYLDNHQSDPRNGQLDTSILPALAMVGFKCRHSSVRQEALALLQKSPGQEYVWSSAMAAAGIKHVIWLEEGDTVIDFMPEESRVSLTGAWMDLQNCLMRLTWNPCKYFPQKAEEEVIISW